MLRILHFLYLLHLSSLSFLLKLVHLLDSLFHLPLLSLLLNHLLDLHFKQIRYGIVKNDLLMVLEIREQEAGNQVSLITVHQKAVFQMLFHGLKTLQVHFLRAEVVQRSLEELHLPQ